ncbi:MAG: hypothetical protein IPF95_11365 [Flavobacteriales bacterium]|nr:hypothetical protein [Flavobacteriales bacterium]MBK9536948.1 hypothetical protein [Flavobacteriales bacterium]MBP9139437.1 hypothetical protein [Flavobacteriales bacterium]HQV53751.1 hypothetical protein [Flavobacteriales bacterium]HQX30746.1 hypothetical protein [Flavobacteriales bacterium]
MILYLTYNDRPSGVYWSQVTDVVMHLNTLGMEPVRLVALVSIRKFWSTRKAIRLRVPDAIVLPMMPRARYWRMNLGWVSMVCRRFKPSGIIGRGIFATHMALEMRERGKIAKVCLDGRGAYAAEWEEYRVVDDERLIEQCRPLEADALHRSDMRISVSRALVKHWKARYGYAGSSYVVIPCTLGIDIIDPVGQDQNAVRAELGWSTGDRIMVYAGSTVGWQSLELVEKQLVPLLAAEPSLKLLFLCEESPETISLMKKFPDQVERRWLRHEQVRRFLMACDIGILLREDSLTNRVASPTKFAEYISAGLPVLISPYLGDLSDLVMEHRLGLVVAEDGSVPPIHCPDQKERERLLSVAREQFTKRAHLTSYTRVLEALR